MSEPASESMSQCTPEPDPRWRNGGAPVSEPASESTSQCTPEPGLGRTGGATVTGPFDWVDARAAEREAAGLRRRVRPRQAQDGVLDLAGNDYLGLCGHPDVLAASSRALEGMGRRFDRVAAGHRVDVAALRARDRRRRPARYGSGAGLLLRLPGQHRSRNRADRARDLDRVRRREPRLTDRRLPPLASSPRGHRRTATWPRSRPRLAPAHRGPGGRPDRRGVLRRRRHRAAGRARRGRPPARRRADRRRGARDRRDRPGGPRRRARGRSGRVPGRRR